MFFDKYFKESDHILLELVRGVHHQLPVAIPSNTLIAIVTIWFFSEAVPILFLLVWIGAVMIVNLVRLYTLRGVQDKNFQITEIKSRASYYVLATTLFGVVWGCLIFFPILAQVTDQGIYELVVACLMIGMCGAAKSILEKQGRANLV